MYHLFDIEELHLRPLSNDPEAVLPGQKFPGPLFEAAAVKVMFQLIVGIWREKLPHCL